MSQGLTDNSVFLSLVIPSYNSGDKLYNNVKELSGYLPGIAESSEIIMVDDGSTDNSTAKCSSIPNVSVLRLDGNSGKGAALRAGVAQSRGKYVVFTDADLPYAMGDINTVLLGLIEGFHLTVGDRTLPGSIYSPAAHLRRLFSRLFSRLVAIYIGRDFGDTQCGLKGFRGDIARRLFSLCQINRFAIDVEILFIATKNNLKIKHVPVHLRHHSNSSVNLLVDPFIMVRDIVMIRYNYWRGRYSGKVQCDA